MTFLYTLIDIFLLIVAPLVILSYEVLTFRDEVIKETETNELLSSFYSMSESMYFVWVVMSYIFLQNNDGLLVLLGLSVLGFFLRKYKAFNIIDSILSIILVIYVVVMNFEYL